MSLPPDIQKQYEQMLKAYNPELYAIKQQLDLLVERKYGTMTVEFAVQAGKVTLMSRQIKITNQADPMTGMIKIVFWRNCLDIV